MAVGSKPWQAIRSVGCGRIRRPDNAAGQSSRRSTGTGRALAVGNRAMDSRTPVLYSGPWAGRSRRPRCPPANSAGRRGSPGRPRGSLPAGCGANRVSEVLVEEVGAYRLVVRTQPVHALPVRITVEPGQLRVSEPDPRRTGRRTPTYRANSSRINGSGRPFPRRARRRRLMRWRHQFGDGPAVASGSQRRGQQGRFVKLSHSRPCYPNKLGRLCALCATSLPTGGARTRA